MGTPDENRRTLWLVFVAGFVLSLIGAVILFTPALEFFVVDIIEKLNLPIGLIGNIAMIGDFALFAVTTLGLIFLSIRYLYAKRHH